MHAMMVKGLFCTEHLNGVTNLKKIAYFFWVIALILSLCFADQY